jgi:hypothetical protein
VCTWADSREMCIHIEKHVVLGHTTYHTLSFLSVVTHDFGHHDDVLMMVYSGSS